MLQHGEWREKPTRLERLDALWDDEKRNISRATTNSEFQTLAAAVHHVGVVEAWHGREAVFDDARPLVEIATRHSIEARVTSFIAGERLLPRLIHRARFSEARRKGVLYEPDVPGKQAGLPESANILPI